MEKQQYDAIIEVLSRTGHCDDLVEALSTTTGFELCQQVEKLQEERTELAKQLLAERNQAEVVRNDLAATYKTITGLRGQVAELQVSEKRANVYVGLASQTADRCRDLYNKTVPEKFEGTTVLGMFMVVCEAVKEAREEVFDLYHQACLVHPNSSDDPIREFQYDNQCMSTYESIEDKLIEWGMLKPEQCLRRNPLKIELLKDAEIKIPVDPAPVTPEWADEEKKDA